VAQAASLQLIAAIPVTHHQVFAREPILEYDRSAHPFRRELIAAPIDQADGRVAIPIRPGLGIEIRRDVLERYRA
jgi:D-galactarolactone cycloisomerase